MISFIVVRWKGGDEVKRCLTSLIKERRSSQAEIVLVDSGSGDGGIPALAREFPSVKILELPENRSFAWAANQGVEASTGPLVYLLNPDTEVETGSTDKLVDFLETNPQIAGVVPLLVDPSGASQHRWQLRQLPGPARLALGLPGKPATRNRIPTSPMPIEQPAAAAWLVRRSVWCTLGGLDPVFEPAWWEDVDFCYRLKSKLANPSEQGFWLVPEAQVQHIGGSSLEKLNNLQFQMIFTKNLMRYARRHYGATVNYIRVALATSLRMRALLRPRHREAYLAAARSL